MKSSLLWLSTTLFLSACASLDPQNPNCSHGWKITGYYTPVESHFDQNHWQTLTLKKAGQFSAPVDFVKAVRIQGWGKTRLGWYLGYYGGRWHKSDHPLDSRGNVLVVGVVAVDNRWVTKPELTIPSLEDVMPVSRFKTKDVGSAVKGKHVDVYTGEGEFAKSIAYQVTHKNTEVCM